MSSGKIKEVVEELWNDPQAKNWEKFSKSLKGSGIKYYKVVFADEGKLNKMQDLTKSFAELYDKNYHAIIRIPIFKKDGKRIRGATIYLKGLDVSNRGY